MPNLKRIVITGGPSTGKTAVIEELEKRGHICIPELVRSMTAAEKQDDGTNNLMTNPILSVKNPEKFNQRLLDGRVAQYRSTEKIYAAKEDVELVFFDRGIPDVHAYMRCFGQAYDETFERPAHQFRYDRVLLMPPWREIYRTDNERFESSEDSD
ncbi:MAG: ATP-binding protein, partial [Pricia sp.]